jgi:NAD(P)-dependent dehydrogenase (short-subunit alcohol dehydrogenase family)
VSPLFLSYSLSKIGLENATRLLADDLAPRIRVNAIAPGPTIEGKHDKKDTFSRLQQFIPLERNSSLKEVCDTVRYILAMPSLTGQTIALSGGLS